MQRVSHSARSALWLVPCLMSSFGCSVIVNSELDGKPVSLADNLDGGSSDAGNGGDLDAGDRADAATNPRDTGGEVAHPEPDTGTPATADNAGYRIVMGGAHGCGLSPDGMATCWGDNTDGQLNLPDTTFKELAAGDGHTCGIKSTGALVCVGRNTRAQRASAPGPFVHVAAGDLHTCALAASGLVTCFGDPTEGQTTPPVGVNFEQIAAGKAFSCGIESVTKRLHCWGRGKSTFENNASMLSLRAVSAGAGVLCAIDDSDGSPKCWGASEFTAPELDPITEISAGFQVCAVLESGSIGCWGESVPVVFDDAMGPYVGVAAGAVAICALPAKGHLICQGFDGATSAVPPPGYP